jgi:hypothetical protein
MEKAIRARKAETPKQPSLRLRLRAPYLYPDPMEISVCHRSHIQQRTLVTVSVESPEVNAVEGRLANQQVVAFVKPGRPEISIVSAEVFKSLTEGR